MTTRVFSSDSSRTSLMPVKHLFVDQLGDALDQLGAVHVIRNLRDDDLLAPALDLLGPQARATRTVAATGFEIRPDARGTLDDAARRKIRTFHILHQTVDRDVRVVDLRADAVDASRSRLCGGMFVAMPTAMPVPPLTSRFGNAAGKTTGSMSLSS